MPKINSIIITDNLKARFWAKVQKTETCWLWTAGLSNGYGSLNSGNRQCGSITAHNLSYVIHKGIIPDGRIVCHRCPGGDNPRCVNPDHLYAGTQSDNRHDAYDHGNKTPITGQLIGVKNPSAKLAEGDVRRILSLRAQGLSYPAIGLRFSITPAHVGRICRGENWGHMGGITPAARDAIVKFVKGRLTSSAKLTCEQAAEIRIEYSKGDVTQAELAARHGLNEHTVQSLLKGKTWKYAGGLGAANGTIDNRRRSHLAGEAHPSAKLNKEKARQIRETYAQGSISHRRLGAQYGVSASTVRRIIKDETWK